MIKVYLLFAVGLVLLIKGGDWFVDGACGIAHRFHIPELLIGATIVSIGTTLPEVMVSATSAVQGHGEIAYGNAVGSVICNTALIAALTITVAPCVVDRKTLRIPVIFFYIAAAVYCITAYTGGYFGRIAGAVLLSCFIAYIVVSVIRAKRNPEDGNPFEDGEDGGDEKELTPAKMVLLLVIGAGAIAEGADLLVDNGTLIAKALGVPESVIGLTMVALGTSLPELATAVTSLVKGHGTLSLGNIVGANLFNLALVCGVAPLLAPFSIPANSFIAGINASLLVEIPVMLFVMSFLTIPGIIRGKLGRAQGIILLCCYAGFLVYQFTAA